MWELVRDIIWGAPPGLQRRLVHDYPWPHWTAVLLVILGWLLVVMVYWREAAPRGCRLAAALLRALAVLILVGVFLYGWQVITDITDLPDLVVVVDDSASMFQADVRPQESSSSSRWTRWEWTYKHLRDEGWLRRWQQRYRVKLYRLARDVRAVEDFSQAEAWSLDAEKPVHQATRLGEGIRSILEQQRGRPTAAVVLFSDGINTDGPPLGDAAAMARRRSLPLYVVGVGDEQPSRDLYIADVLGDDVVFAGDMAYFEVRIGGRGTTSEQLLVRVRRKEQEQVLAERTVTWKADTNLLTAQLAFRADEVGEWDLVFELRLATADVNPGNDRLERHLSIRDEQLRVLYVQQYPNFDFRYLKAVLERGLHRSSDGRKAIALSVMLQEADAEYPSIDASAIRAFPVDRQELFRYDVVIFGDVDPALFPTRLLENIVAFVEERGGGLIVICGPRHTPWAYRGSPLARLLPAPPEHVSQPPEALQPLQAIVTPMGQQSPLLQLDEEPSPNGLWSEMPRIYWLAQARQLRPAARTLVEARGEDGHRWPLVITQFVGAGKVVMIMTDELFRWAKHPDGDAYYGRFWLQTLRYLSRAKLLGTDRTVELTVDQPSYQPGETVTVTARFLDDRLAPEADDGVTVTVEHQAGRQVSLPLRRDQGRRGIFRGTWIPDGAGEYRVWLTAPAPQGHPPAARFAVVAPRGELARLEMDAAHLRQAAQLSGGRYYTTQTAHQLDHDLPEGRQVRIESLPARPIWNSSWWVALFVLLVTAEWIIRKWGRML